MAISFVATTSKTGVSAPCVLDVPAGVADNDFLLATIYFTGTGSGTPSGWTRINLTNPSAGEEFVSFWKIAASEPSNYSFTNSGGGAFAATMNAWRGVNTSSPIDVALATGTIASSGTTITAPTVTTVTNGAWLICQFGVRATLTESFSTPGGMTERNDVALASICGVAVDDETRASAGATGTRATTVSATIDRGGQGLSFGLKPFVATAPGAPTLGTITPGNASLSAAFTAGSDGGSSITAYKYSTDNGATYLTRQSGSTASPIAITTLSSDGTTPLSNGTSYTVLIKAVNAVGDGTASNAVAATPSTTPSAPTLGAITPSSAQLSAAFTAGGTGGSSITSYKYSTDNGVSYLTRQTGTTASPIVITTLSSDGTTPLVNGTPYTVLIKAVNANGDGVASNAVTATPSTTPSAPTALVVTPGNASLSVAFTAGATGGSALTTYKYSTDNGATYLARQSGTTASPVVITTLSSDGSTPLVNGVTYQVLLKAVNANGDGTASAEVDGTPSTTPDAPTALVATGGNAQISVAFTAGATGGSALTSYKYSTDNGSTYRTRQTGTTASPVVITTLSADGTTPLSNGVTYQIRLKAVNANGDGTASSAVAGTPTNPTTDLKAALTMQVGGM